MAGPAASVIIPNWNGASLLPTCLTALQRQTWTSFETVVVDNGSTDGSRALIARDFPMVHVIPLAENRLFAGAVNEGIRQTDSPIVVLLNNDTEAEPAWLERLLGGLDKPVPPSPPSGTAPGRRSDDPTPPAVIGMAASKLLLYDRRDVLHSAGDFYRRDGVPGNRGVWEVDEGQYDRETMVFGPCAGAAAYRRAMLDDIGLFDEDLGAYCEDVDLAFRAQLAGYRCVFVPEARVYHRLSATGGGPLASYYCGRNFIAVAVKNMPLGLFRRHWPRMVAAQGRLTWESLRHIREPAARARLRGQWEGLRGLPAVWAKRRQLLELQRVPDCYIEELLHSGEERGMRYEAQVTTSPPA